MSTGKWKKPTGVTQTTRWQERQLRKASPRDRMLYDMVQAPTPQAKRDIIKTFNPYFFMFGESLDPRNPYEENANEELRICL